MQHAMENQGPNVTGVALTVEIETFVLQLNVHTAAQNGDLVALELVREIAQHRLHAYEAAARRSSSLDCRTAE